MNTKYKIENISNQENTLIYDIKNKASVMVKIPKFYLDDVIAGATHTVHPAFIVDGVEKDYFYVSKYQNIIDWNTELPYSFGGDIPTRCDVNNTLKKSPTLEYLKTICKNKGNGWHLMTNSEWSAIALLSLKNGTLPLGNTTAKGYSDYNKNKKSMVVGTEWDAININSTQPKEFSHNGTTNGVFDMCGNLIERIDGARIVNYEIQIYENNNKTNVSWKAIMPDGSLVEPGTSGTLKFGSSGIVTESGSAISYSVNFKDFVENGVSIPMILKALCLFPTTEFKSKSLYDFGEVKTGELYLMRGGSYGNGNRAGIFAFNAQTTNQINATYGFRSCYIV